jgi:hypothetical protein
VIPFPFFHFLSFYPTQFLVFFFRLTNIEDSSKAGGGVQLREWEKKGKLEESQKIVLSFLQLLVNNTPESEKFWKSKIQVLLEQKFPSSLVIFKKEGFFFFSFSFSFFLGSQLLRARFQFEIPH